MHWPSTDHTRAYRMLFLASALALFFELIVIRYLSSEVRVFAYLKNLPLVAAFFGLGLGMVLGKREALFTRILPFTALALFLIVHLAPQLGLVHLPFPHDDFVIWGIIGKSSSAALALLKYLGVVSLLAALIVFFCIPLGSRIGALLEDLPPLSGYAADLAGSLVGIAAFTALSFLGTPPWVWAALGFGLLAWQYRRNAVAVVTFLLIPLMLFQGDPGAIWSPYYRIDVKPGPVREDGTRQSVTYVSVNHDYHQKVLDLSTAYLAAHPNEEPNATAALTYEFPYLSHPAPERVLVVGSGTGNDVAAALRNGAKQVDAVEIDPSILALGRRIHPERPYDDPRVTPHLDDARAFLERATGPYDLIVFAYLDSHTLVANAGALRLDNYVYTVESFERAKELLAPNGTLVVAFGAGKTFASARMYGMLRTAFGRAPASYFTDYDGGGVVFVSGAAPGAADGRLAAITRVDGEMERWAGTLKPATDQWPFLYLLEPKVPSAYAVVFILVGVAWLFARRALALERVWTREHLHFFALGAGFLLLETKAVTELALLFGSTWLVNTIAIVSFLCMAVAANALCMRWRMPRRIAFALLFVSLAVGLLVPTSALAGLSLAGKLAASTALFALPVFFSGTLFSHAFRETENPGKALGVNLLGALVGGVAENAVMIGGAMLLGVLAIVFYGVALVAVFMRKR